MLDLLKARKKGKGKYYTPQYVIAVVYPPLARYAPIWSEVARQVFKDRGRKSGFKDEMTPWFSAIHRGVLKHADYKKLKRKRAKDILRISTIKSNIPNGVAEISWHDAVERVYDGELWTTRKEYEQKLSGMISHAYNNMKLYKVKK